MDFLITAYKTILYQPLLNALVLLYLYLPGHDFGVAVIVLTLIIRLILLPASLRAVRSQKTLSTLQPKIKKIQEKFKNDRQKQSQAMLELYRQEKINPLSGCLPLLLQLPILIALYQVFLRGLKPETLKPALYSFVSYPGQITPTFLGILDLSQPNFWLALVAGVLQFFQSKLASPKEKPSKKDFSSMFQNQMLYFFPFLTVLIVWRLGSIIGLYWIVTTLFSIGEHYLVQKRVPKNYGRTKD